MPPAPKPHGGNSAEQQNLHADPTTILQRVTGTAGLRHRGLGAAPGAGSRARVLLLLPAGGRAGVHSGQQHRAVGLPGVWGRAFKNEAQNPTVNDCQLVGGQQHALGS